VPVPAFCADGSTPDALRERLQARAADGSFEVVRVDPDLWPTHVRRKLVATVDSDYVVFVDNDLIVEPGRLEALIACADETDAEAPLERRVRAYSRRGEELDSLASRRDRIDEMSVDDAEIVAVVAANEVDMMLGGEYRYTMRDDAMAADALALVRGVCTALGAPGLAATLEECVAAPSAPPELRTRTLGSYRIVGLERKPMVSRAFAEFDRSAREPKPTD
jgi:hypothetical protein